MAFVLKSILSNMCIVNPAFLSFPFAWNIFFYPLTFNLCVSFALKWVSYRQNIVGSCFSFQSTTPCLLIRVLSLLRFKVIIDKHVFIAMLNLVFLFILCFSFVPFFFFLWFDDFLLFYVCVLFFLFFVNLPIQDISCVWNHTICHLLYGALFI